MAENIEIQTNVEPAAVPRPRTIRLSLRRFADSPCQPQNIEQHTTSICNDVWDAAHSETEHMDAVARALCPEFKPRVEAMLGVISYCYTKGLFNSEEIERRLWEDEDFLATFGEEIPSAQQIRKFRRRHRPHIVAVIEQALQHYWQRPDSPGVLPLPPDRGVAQRRAQQLLDMANVMDQLASD